MFHQKITNGVVIPILRSSRFMSKSNRMPIQNTRSPVVKEKLPDLPFLELISTKNLNIETHITSQKVQYGEYEFIECKEGYILCYIHGYLRKKEPQDVFYGVYYGAKNPLNTNGPVKGIQSLSHAKETAVLRAIEMFPKIENKKLCICTDCTRTIKTMGRLSLYDENGYRSNIGRVIQTKDTYEALVKTIRLRTDILLRFLYTPSDVVYIMKEALRLATLASK